MIFLAEEHKNIFMNDVKISMFRCAYFYIKS